MVSRMGFLTLTSPAKVNVKRAGKPIAEPKHISHCKSPLNLARETEHQRQRRG